MMTLDAALPAIHSDEDCRAAVMRLEPWRDALDAIIRRAGIPVDDDIRVSTCCNYAAFFLPPDHYVKIYLPRLRGHQRHEAEVAALRMLERDPELAVPRLVDAGRVGAEGRYLVMTRVPGSELRGVREAIDDASMARILGWAGRFLTDLRTIPLDVDEQAAGWEPFRQVVHNLRGSAEAHARRRGRMPEHLIEAIDAFLPTDDELAGNADALILSQGSFKSKHVMVGRRGAGWDAVGVIDFNSARLAHPMWDLAYAWGDLRREPAEIVDAFMGAAAFPGFGEAEFPRTALAWAIIQRWDRAYAPDDYDGLATLDDLAEHVYGRANAAAV